MRRGDVAAALERGGFPQESAPAKVRLFDQCDALRSRLGWAGADHAWWIPGRLEVFGKHTDYAGGRTLVAALPRGFVLLAATASTSSPGVKAADALTGEIASSPHSDDREQRPGWAHYLDAVVQRLARNFPAAAFSAEIVFASDLQPAAGMSSSSALMVGLAAALVRLSDIESLEAWQRNITGPLDAAAYYACIENGATFRGLAGDTGVGTHGGSEDHAAILCGSPAQLTTFAFVPLRLMARTPVPPEWQFVIASSGVRAEKTGAARDAYNALSGDTTALLQLWNEHEFGGSHELAAVSLGEALASGSQSEARLVELIEGSSLPGSRREALARRLTHFVREDSRVPDAVAAFESGDAVALAALALASQREAEALLRNQVAETVELAAVARRLGAIAASAFGAGFGGSVWALVERDAAPAFTARWLAACRPACSRDATVFDAWPGPPLMHLTS